MGYQEAFIQIQALLGNDDEITIQIEDIISRGATGGEISSMVGFYLKGLCKEQHSSLPLIKPYIDSFLNECENSGLFIA